MRSLTRFLRLPRAEQWLLLQAVVLLPLVAVLLRTIGLARCWALLRRAAGSAGEDLARTSRTSPPVPLSPSLCSGQALSGEGERTLHTVQTGIARMVDVAARHLPWQPACLPRSLVLWFLLRRRGVPAELRIGVRKSDERLEAHAWVEVEQRVVNDAPDIAAEYPPFASIAEALGLTP